MWISARARNAILKLTFAKSLTAVAVALVVLPMTVLAGPDGRRQTLGANRASLETAPGHSFTLDQAASSSVLTSQATVSNAAPVPLPVQADTPPVRVLPPNAQAVTPDFESEPKVAAAPARAERLRHTAVRKTKVTVKTTPESRHVHVTAPATRESVRDHKVRVDAPYTRVAVDEGRVRVRAPYVDLDIRF